MSQTIENIRRNLLALEGKRFVVADVTAEEYNHERTKLGWGKIDFSKYIFQVEKGVLYLKNERVGAVEDFTAALTVFLPLSFTFALALADNDIKVLPDEPMIFVDEKTGK